MEKVTVRKRKKSSGLIRQVEELRPLSEWIDKEEVKKNKIKTFLNHLWLRGIFPRRKKIGAILLISGILLFFVSFLVYLGNAENQTPNALNPAFINMVILYLIAGAVLLSEDISKWQDLILNIAKKLVFFVILLQFTSWSLSYILDVIHQEKISSGHHIINSIAFIIFIAMIVNIICLIFKKIISSLEYLSKIAKPIQLGIATIGSIIATSAVIFQIWQIGSSN